MKFRLTQNIPGVHSWLEENRTGITDEHVSLDQDATFVTRNPTVSFSSGRGRHRKTLTIYLGPLPTAQTLQGHPSEGLAIAGRIRGYHSKPFGERVPYERDVSSLDRKMIRLLHNELGKDIHNDLPFSPAVRRNLRRALVQLDRDLSREWSSDLALRMNGNLGRTEIRKVEATRRVLDFVVKPTLLSHRGR